MRIAFVSMFVAFVALAPSRAEAQRDELVAAEVLYGTGMLVMTVGMITSVVGFLDLVNCTPNPMLGGRCTDEDGDFRAWVVGLVMLGLGAIEIGVAIALDTDHRSRRDGRARSVRLGPGPGQVGVSLTFEL